MPTTTRLGRPLLGLTIASLIVACSGAASSAPVPPAAPARSLAPSASSPVPELVGQSDAWLVVGHPGDDRLHVILASTEEEMVSLPIGAPDDGWAHVITATLGQSATTVEDLRAERAFDGHGREVTGFWRLPTIGLDPVPAGLSADGSTIVLVGADTGTATPGSSRFAVLSRTLDQDARVIELPGTFEFDALSPDGSLLYVIEQMPGPPAGHYQVRVVETATGVLRPAVVADKTKIDEAMAGWPIAQDRRPDGLVFTLYRGSEHPFIHALNSVEAWAICIDLPAAGADDAAAALDWGLTPAPDGRHILAINATLGLAVDVDPSNFAILRSVSFDPSAARGITLAKFGHQPSGPVGRRVVTAPGGDTIYAAGAGGIVRIDSHDLHVTGRFVEGAAVDAMAVTPDGATIYALMSAGGKIVKLDARSGDIIGRVPGDGYDRLVAIVPY